MEKGAADAPVIVTVLQESSLLIKALKREMDRMLLLKISEPSTDVVARFQPVVATVRKLLRAELEG
jgi:hypothetical protein